MDLSHCSMAFSAYFDSSFPIDPFTWMKNTCNIHDLFNSLIHTMNLIHRRVIFDHLWGSRWSASESAKYSRQDRLLFRVFRMRYVPYVESFRNVENLLERSHPSLIEHGVSAVNVSFEGYSFSIPYSPFFLSSSYFLFPFTIASFINWIISGGHIVCCNSLISLQLGL